MKNFIIDHRKQKKLTQDELAKIVGVTRQTIISIEKGKYKPSLPLAFKLARALQTTVDELFIMEDE